MSATYFGGLSPSHQREYVARGRDVFRQLLQLAPAGFADQVRLALPRQVVRSGLNVCMLSGQPFLGRLSSRICVHSHCSCRKDAVCTHEPTASVQVVVCMQHVSCHLAACHVIPSLQTADDAQPAEDPDATASGLQQLPPAAAREWCTECAKLAGVLERMSPVLFTVRSSLSQAGRPRRWFVACVELLLCPGALRAVRCRGTSLMARLFLGAPAGVHCMQLSQHQVLTTSPCVMQDMLIALEASAWPYDEYKTPALMQVVRNLPGSSTSAFPRNTAALAQTVQPFKALLQTGLLQRGDGESRGSAAPEFSWNEQLLVRWPCLHCTVRLVFCSPGIACCLCACRSTRAHACGGADLAWLLHRAWWPHHCNALRHGRSSACDSAAEVYPPTVL